MPGSPLDPRCQGANRLIRDGAMLVETAADILEALAGQMRRIEEPSRGDWGAADAGADAYGPQDTARARTDVLEALSFTPIHRDEILRAVGAPAGLVNRHSTRSRPRGVGGGTFGRPVLAESLTDGGVDNALRFLLGGPQIVLKFDKAMAAGEPLQLPEQVANILSGLRLIRHSGMVRRPLRLLNCLIYWHKFPSLHGRLYARTVASIATLNVNLNTTQPAVVDKNRARLTFLPSRTHFPPPSRPASAPLG